MAALQFYWRAKFGRKITMTGKVYFGRHTKVQLSSGSTKKDIVVGNDVKLYGTLVSHNGGKIVIEDSAHIGPFTTVGAAKCVWIKAFAMISRNVDIIDNNNHPVHPDDRRAMNMAPVGSPLKTWKFSKAAAIEIGENTWVGKNAVIMKGVTVEANTIVGACAVVTKSTPANAVVAGNPARVVKDDVRNEPRILC
jgi:acetyltransferase-like isoleucine patch superfamily enzyme